MPWDTGRSPRPASAPTDDVKVAGAPFTGGPGLPGEPGGTAVLPTAGEPTSRYGLPPYGAPDGVAPFGAGGEEPVDEFEAMRRTPRSRQKLIKVAAVAAAAVVVGGGAIGTGWALTGGSGSGDDSKSGTRQLQADAPAPAPLTDAQRKAAENARLKELKKRASRAARADHRRPVLLAKGTPPPTKKPSSPPPAGAGDPVPASEAQRIARAMLPSYGWSPSSQFGCLVNLWNKESHWNVHAQNPSGAYGIPQALPGSKMASAGPDWQNNARTQIKWGLGYIKDRYGSPCAAWAHSQSTGWY